MTKRYRKPQYPSNWEEIARKCKEAAGYRCEWCGVEQGATRLNLKGKPYKVTLTVHHPGGDTLNPDATIHCLCAVCHLRDDAAMHAKHAKETHHRKKHEQAVAAGQLTWEESIS